MKTLKQTIASGLLIGLMPVMAMAADNQTTAEQFLNARLNKVSQTEDGLKIRMASPDVVKAVKNLNNNAVVEFGAKEKIDLRSLKSGGVIVGSGADGLIATSNVSASGSVVVNPPLQPKTSLTVTGRAGAQQGNRFCVRKLATDKVGNLLPHGTSFYIGSSDGCHILNHALRLSEGTYLVTFNSTFLITSLSKNENKIIPLREVIIPAVNTPLDFALRRDATADSELTKEFYANYAIIKGSRLDNLSLEAFKTTMKKLLLDEIIICGSSENSEVNSVSTVLECGTSGYSGGKGNFLGAFVSVLPGVYKIKWLIDGNYDTTSGIVVE